MAQQVSELGQYFNESVLAKLDSAESRTDFRGAAVDILKEKGCANLEGQAGRDKPPIGASRLFAPLGS